MKKKELYATVSKGEGHMEHLHKVGKQVRVLEVKKTVSAAELMALWKPRS
jgi:hypothetical protein